jgi:hypothetical protein
MFAICKVINNENFSRPRAAACFENAVTTIMVDNQKIYVTSNAAYL